MSPRRQLVPFAYALTHEITPATMRSATRTAVRCAALIAVPILFETNQPRLGICLALIAIGFEIWVSQSNGEQGHRESLLRTIVAGIEARDLRDPGHGKRVGHMAATIGRHLCLSSSHVAELRLIGQLHDIGKLQSHFADLLRRPSELSIHERMLVESHAQQGAEFISMFPDMRHLAPPIGAHHENFDGTGYPLGLSGSAIPLEARVIRVADSMDAMMHDRPYRSALTPDALRNELLRCRGQAFDPYIVDTVLTLECWNELQRSRESKSAPAVDEVVTEPQLTVEPGGRALRAIGTR